MSVTLIVFFLRALAEQYYEQALLMIDSGHVQKAVEALEKVRAFKTSLETQQVV